MSISTIDELGAAVRRKASVGKAIQRRPDDDPRRSWLGRVAVLGEGEVWPEHEGRPMLGLAQLNLTEAPFVPESLAGIAMVTIFLAEGDGWFLDPSDRPSGDGWTIRTYRILDGLVAAHGPTLPDIEPRQLDWEVIDDYPALEDLSNEIDDDVVDEILEGRYFEDVIGSPAEGPKLGGWPSTIQGELSWAPWNQHAASPEFCIQIDADRATNLAPLGSGVLYLGLGSVDGEPVWAATTQYP